LPDYEQVATKLYDQVSFTDILLAAGSKAGFFFYNSTDRCCFRFTQQNPWIQYLVKASQSNTAKTYRVFLDRANTHGLTPLALDVLGGFLSELGLATPPSK
jgi:hypothetical protein